MNDTDDYFLWENQTTTTNNWIKIKLEGVTSNKDGYGNRIEVHANGKSQYKFTVCGEGYLSQNSQYEFVGVEAATNIDYIKVTWNKTGIVETINNVTPNQAITIQEGNGILSTSNEELQGFSIYPNPSEGGVFNFSKINNDNYFVQIFDISGRMVFSQNQVDNTIDLTSLTTGVYVAKVKSGEKIKTVKLIKN